MTEYYLQYFHKSNLNLVRKIFQRNLTNLEVLDNNLFQGRDYFEKYYYQYIVDLNKIKDSKYFIR